MISSLVRRAPLAGALALVPLCAPAGAQQLDTIQLEPTEMLENHNFSRIRGLLELSDGRLLIADQTEKAIYVVDMAASTRSRVGTNGAGPNEYEQPVGLHPFGRDRALVVDFGNMRLAVLDSAQRMGATMPVFASGRSLPEATDDRQRMYYDDVTDVRIRKAEEGGGDEAWVYRWHESTGADSVAPLRIPGPPNALVFPNWDVWTADRAGRVVVVRNQDEFRVDWYYPDGREVRGERVREDRFRLGRAEQDEYLRTHPGGVSGARVTDPDDDSPPVRRRPDIDFPDFLPYAIGNDVWIDARGRAWVGRYRPASEEKPIHDVFDGQGRRIARVRLPVGREIVGFGERGLYAVRRDEFDLLWIERYDLSPLPGGG